MQGKFKNLIGMKFGRLTVYNLIGKNKFSDRRWECLCDCGKVHISPGDSLRRGSSKSCGCLQKDIAAKQMSIIGKKNRKSDGYASSKTLYVRYKSRAKRKGIIFNLKLTNFRKLTKQKCYYCNKKPNMISRHPNSPTTYIYNSLDRVSVEKGYTINNVVPACLQCNLAKKTMTTIEFMDWIIDVYNHFIKVTK